MEKLHSKPKQSSKNFEASFFLVTETFKGNLFENKPGTAQVGFISKAQKYSRNNNWKNLEKKYLVKKVAFCRKTQKETL